MKLTSVILQENSLASRAVRNLVGERVINLAEDIGAAVLHVQEERITCINQRSIIGAVLLSDVA